ncbi:lantibiotic dehydratase [Actinomadura rayongensis]|uniref:Lantibiotic dehydratase n=1 Tax=Actinomadura rayongensis TaxID=1429076 RepID=A0A6I4W7Z1_9ACTN|nr:lantibiotic dehydratase [Actinomadura rayongensis]MXQ65591.1 lantibiotic dehydratase [Actinomadura rayongensis]
MYHAVPGAALVRAAAHPADLVLPTWPDLTADQPDAWVGWLREAWALPGFSAAMTAATPQLTAQIVHTLDATPTAGQKIGRREVRTLRRLVEATVRYLLRWTTRPTPFGRFAGVAPVGFGVQAAVRWDGHHHAVVRPDDRWVTESATAAERDLPTLRSVAVMTNALGHARGGMWVLPCARMTDGRFWDVEIELTEPVRTAVEAAASPVAFTTLAARVGRDLPGGVAAAERLLAALVEAGVLLSQIRPPMTVTDPAAHLNHHVPDRARQPEPGDRIAVDLRVGCSVTLPPPVVAQAQDAAETLAAVAPRLPGWADYHAAFLERWGPGAAVPLREVVAALGFPAGYRSSPHRRGPAIFGPRDALLADLAQRAALDLGSGGDAEIVLDDELVASLRGDDDRPPIPHTELRFTLAADQAADLDKGAFTLTVTSGARHAGVTAARFLHLLTPGEREQFRRAYQRLPTAMPGSGLVQLSGPPLDARMATVARTPELLPVLPVGDFHPDAAWTLADLAVAGDSHRLWLVSRTTGQPVEPLLFNSVRLQNLQQPLVRFLTEIWTAWTAPCAPFDWGRASSLSFLPRVRRGRAILHPARWVVHGTELPDRAATWPQWRTAWRRHRDHHRIPRYVLFGGDDVRLRLDMEEPAHLAVLRSHLDRHPNAVLTEAPGPAGWIAGRAAELMLTLARTPSSDRLRPARPATTLHHRPGRSRWLDARLYGTVERIVARLATRPGLPTGWWFLRYPDPQPHMRLRVPFPAGTELASAFAEAADDLARWAEELAEDGLLHDYTLNTYRPETRHGTGPTLRAAEAVFAADSSAVVRRLPGDREAATAGGMRAIADAFTGDGARWLAEHVPHRGGPRLDPAQLDRARRPVADDAVARTLARYRFLVDQDGLDPDQVLADLLHLHHARMIGADMASERHCLRLARTVARTDLIRRAPRELP